MFRLTPLWVLVAASAGASVSAQTPTVSGSIQSALVSGKFFGQYLNSDRYTRTQAVVEQGSWLATVSIWNYTFCNWHDLDETNLAYRFQNRQVKVGRFLNPVGMSTWDDQWYSAFVFVPNVELNNYGGRKIFERTLTGIQVDSTVGANSFKFSATSARFQQDQLLPDRLDRVSARWTHYDKGTVYGAAILADTERSGGKEQVVALDVRHTIPHWIFRGQVIGYANEVSRSNGFFAELTHRQPGWEDLTLGLRHEGVLGFVGAADWLFASTASAKVELPLGVTFVANYTFGPDMNRQPLGGGFAFGMSKTLRF